MMPGKEEKKPAPAANPSITATRSELVEAYRFWEQDNRSGKFETVNDLDKHANRSANALMGYLKALAK